MTSLGSGKGEQCRNLHHRLRSEFIPSVAYGPGLQYQWGRSSRLSRSRERGGHKTT